MKLRKLASVALAGVMTLSLAACGGNSSAPATTAAPAAETTAAASEAASEETEAAAEATGGIAKDDLKVGFVYIGDENEGYTAAHYEGAMKMKEALGLSDDQIIIKWNIPEDETCKDAAMDLADQGCQIVFANSFGHESYIIEAAKEYPEVQFCHATGFQAASSGLANMHNYFTSIYEARYVSGVVAGMKLNQMIEDGTVAKDACKIGYVGAYPYAEVISGYTSFFLGVRSVCPDATMEVKYTNSWASFDLEKEAADALISDGCVLISQHADTTGAPTACEAAGVPCVGYNISMIATAPNAALTSSTNNWAAYVTYAVQCMLDGTEIPVDWCKGFAEGAVQITELNDAVVAPGTAEKVKEVEDALTAGTLHVFDTSTWTVNGETLETYEKNGIEYISDGYFHESEFASAPAFDILIDGITTIDN
ncbi:BMP family ABC transporter substrate-binding protein [Lacrimispora sp. 210928-DFI.3.58]|uniref:BMP family ABC transporter substrate-binding protein n=1 Tax=Lacrimispora sp. 210928-DFI.3.58 TaxID=2883214 RepID=UPI0015B77F81|nr:BMP family ABC transporter substrate-binding protein [Lacrimispora sp. 210928-DFI.3.58]MCB7319694.1 BMP family ABC transporter substrate-binding protein [Lacrimispora sp. 210928-DFI.3.58]